MKGRGREREGVGGREAGGKREREVDAEKGRSRWNVDGRNEEEADAVGNKQTGKKTDGYRLLEKMRLSD